MRWKETMILGSSTSKMLMRLLAFLGSRGSCKDRVMVRGRRGGGLRKVDSPGKETGHDALGPNREDKAGSRRPGDPEDDGA